ncbi:PAS domain S-box protein, partial [Acidimicrobiaceae bacterium USS-CC1]|nr:PAS domain S-box protein [Acidiferrimicrobium australe]
MRRVSRDARLRLEAVAQHLPDGLLVVDAGGRIGLVNDLLAAMTGYAEADLLGQPVERLLPGGLPPAGDPAGGPGAPGSPGGDRVRVRLTRRDGTCVPVEVTARSAVIDGARVTVVTARPAGGRDPSEAERRWDDLVAGVGLAVVGLDRHGHITFANPFFLALTGYEAQEVLGAEWFSTFIPADAGAEVEAVFADVVGSSLADHHVNPILTKAGRRRLVAWFNTVQRGPDGAVQGTLSIGDDITDRVRTEAQLRAVGEVTDGVLGGRPLAELLRLLAGHTRRLVGADAALVLLPHDGETLVVAAAEGTDAARLEGRILAQGASIAGAVLRAQRAEVVGDASRDPRITRELIESAEIGPAMFVPLSAAERGLGTLLVANGRGGRRFDDDDLAIVEAVASHASVAVEYTRAQREMQRLAVMEERERIARDLHDHVIQRLFAIGLGLAAVRGGQLEPQVTDRLAEAVDALDLAIADLRTSIFDLRRSPRPGGLRGEILAVADESTGPLGFQPQVRFGGPVDTSGGDDLAAHVVGVVREGLANVARHARAGR